MRHRAWLNAVPESTSESKKRNTLTRREAFVREGADVTAIPECRAPHILSYLFEIGPTLSSGVGPVPITHGELHAWQMNTGTPLEAYEVRMLKRLSADYAHSVILSTKEDCPAPWAAAPYIKSSAMLVAKRMKDSVKKLTKL